MISFHNSVCEEKLTTLTSDLKTYLFACGKNLLLNLNKKNAKVVHLFDSNVINHSSSEILEEESKKYNQELIQNAIVKLPETCQKVLTLYYFNEYDMDSISQELNYKNSNVAKKKKCDCMKKLAEIVKEIQKQSKV